MGRPFRSVFVMMPHHFDGGEDQQHDDEDCRHAFSHQYQGCVYRIHMCLLEESGNQREDDASGDDRADLSGYVGRHGVHQQVVL